MLGTKRWYPPEQDKRHYPKSTGPDLSHITEYHDTSIELCIAVKSVPPPSVCVCVCVMCEVALQITLSCGKPVMICFLSICQWNLLSLTELLLYCVFGFSTELSWTPPSTTEFLELRKFLGRARSVDSQSFCDKLSNVRGSGSEICSLKKHFRFTLIFRTKLFFEI